MKRAALTTSPRAANILTRDAVLVFSDEDSLHVRLRLTGVTESTRTDLSALEADLPRLVEADEDEAAAGMGAARDTFATVISELVASWDLEDEDGPVPPTPEGLATFGFVELVVIATALLEEVQAVPFSHPSKPSKPSRRPAAKPRRS